MMMTHMRPLRGRRVSMRVVRLSLLLALLLTLVGAPGASVTRAASGVLYDQAGALGASSNLEGYEYADDFSIPAPNVWSIEQVADSVFSSYADSPVTISFYQDSGGVPGSRVYQATNLTASVDGDYLVYTLPAPPTLGPGSYWMGIAANQQYLERTLSPVTYGSHQAFRLLSDARWDVDPSNYERIFRLSGASVSDTTAPAASPTISSGTPGSNGWYVSNVTLSWNWSDTGSGIDPALCAATGTSSGEGSISLTATCRDKAGNTGNASYALKVDTIAPMVQRDAVATCSAPGTNGWCRGTVTTSFSASDATSGVESPCSGATCKFPRSTTANGMGVMIASGPVCDAAGNCAASIDAGPFKIDSVAPALNPSVSPSPVLLNGSATASPNASDAMSGVAAQSCGALDTSSVGNKTVTCSASDNAGNSASQAVSYKVIYSFSGFFAPVLNAPALNPVTAGNNVAFKFSLAGNQGPIILAANFPASRQIDCKTLAPLGGYQAASPSGKSGVQYDAATNQYIYTWKTGKAWAGTCRQFDLTLIDGTEHLANFRFK
jgi:hypothetical protein